jgi:senataxin
MVLARDDIGQKILVCAPSNAAVDEIILRIQKLKLISLSGKTHEVSLVRIGAHDYEPPQEVRQRTLDYLVEKEMGGEAVKVDFARVDEMKDKIHNIDKIQQVTERMMKDDPETNFAQIYEKCRKEFKAITASMLPDDKKSFLTNGNAEV